MALKVVSEAKKTEKPLKVAKEKAVKAVKAAPPAKEEPSAKAKAEVVKAPKTEAVKAESKDVEVVKEKAAPKAAAVDSLLGEAREAYKNFQHSWFRFAKKVTQVQKAEDSWINAGYDTFKDYCVAEFPDVSYTTILKFVRVIESMGTALEARLTKTPEKKFPGFTACYEFLNVQDKLPKDEVPKIRKDVIEGNLSRRAVVDLADPAVKSEAQENKRRAAEAKKIDKAVEKDAKKAAKPLTVAPTEAAQIQSDSVDVNADLSANVEDQIQALLDRVTYINDNLPLVTSALKKPTAKAVKLAEALEKLVERSDKYLDKVSEG